MPVNKALFLQGGSQGGPSSSSTEQRSQTPQPYCFLSILITTHIYFTILFLKLQQRNTMKIVLMTVFTVIDWLINCLDNYWPFSLNIVFIEI